MDVLTPGSGVNEVVFEKGAQVGGSEVGNNLVGYTMDEDPGPMLHVMPNEEMAKRNSKTRIGPMIAACPALAEKMTTKGNTVLEKDFPGGVWVSVGANSPSQLRSMPCKRVILDEEDATPDDVGGEGNVKDLAAARLRTFSDSLLLRISTPTLEGSSAIDAAYQDSDRRRYEVPCPHCGAFQPLLWERVRWNDGATEAWYQCSHCDGRIEEHQKTLFLARGRWVPMNPGHHVAGFHLSSLYSPFGWYSWLEAARHWLRAQDSDSVMKTFVNTVLGLPYRPKTDVPAWQELRDRPRMHSQGTVPPGVGLLTAGVDIQADRIECEVVGWGPRFCTWSITYNVIKGSTADPSTWDRLATVLDGCYARSDGRTFEIRKVAIDSGYNTQEVYRFSLQRPKQVMVVKGHATYKALLMAPSKMDVGEEGKKKSFGGRLWGVGVSVAKMELYGWLRNPPGSAGYCLWPYEYEDEYFRQLTAERMVLGYSKGYENWTWEKHRPRNEALDCRVYARAAAAACGVDSMTDDKWDVLLTDGVFPEAPTTAGTFA